MNPPEPPPQGKPFCVSHSTITFTYHPTLEAAEADYQDLIQAERALPHINDGHEVTLWEVFAGVWTEEVTEAFPPKPQP